MRARSRTVAAAAVAVAALMLVHPARAGGVPDADDVPGDRFDIARVGVEATREPNGVRIFVLRLRTYTGFRLRGCRCAFAFVLDGRGDGRGDLAVVAKGRTDGSRSIAVARNRDGTFRHDVVVHKDGWRRLRIVLPREWLEPTRGVRFRATSRANGTTDRAPDRGRSAV